jgi:ATP-dependent Lon protease
MNEFTDSTPSDVVRCPLISMRDVVVFPHTIVKFKVGRSRSVHGLEAALRGDKTVFLVTQHDATVDEPILDQIYTVGTIAKITHQRSPDDKIEVIVEGLERARLVRVEDDSGYWLAILRRMPEKIRSPARFSTIIGRISSLVDQYVRQSIDLDKPEALTAALTNDDPARLCDTIASNLKVSLEYKQGLLETFPLQNRLARLVEFFEIELEKIRKIQLDGAIDVQAQRQMERAQKEYVLNEKIKAIHKELGRKDEKADLEELKQKVDAAGMPKDAHDKATTELQRLEQMLPGSAEVAMVRNHIGWLLAVPWKQASKEILDLTRAERILNEDHYGLTAVKERILEHLSVRKLLGKPTGSMLCLVGPPGVGKTSLGYSLAKAMKRRFVRLSLGGIRDEAQIRGHARTYINALPGQIIGMMRKAGTINPVFVLDELDKVSHDTNYGNPAAALLEVLDPEQNSRFRDHYLDVEYDLSKVLFIGTCNATDTISPVLRDRLEIISLPAYTDSEKLQIALRHLVPKKLRSTGLRENQVRFTKAGLSRIIQEYTREEGVKMLERRIEAICRKLAHRLVIASEANHEVVRADGEAHKVTVDSGTVDLLLAAEESRHVVINRQAVAIAALDQRVIGHAEAKRNLVAAATLHYAWVNGESVGKNLRELTASTLLVGPEGVGKTHLVKSLAQYLKVPFVQIDAVQLAGTRYPYTPGQKLLKALFQAADQKVDHLRDGIVCLQRMDRLMIHGNDQETASLAQMQQAICNLISGEEEELHLTQSPSQQQTITVDTRQLLFFCEATFARIGQLYDLLDHGFLPELAACFRTTVTLDDVSLVDIKQLLKPDSQTGPAANYLRLLKAQGIEVDLTEEGLEEIAIEALARKNGMRGAEQVLRDLYIYLLCDTQRPGPVSLSKDMVREALARTKESNREFDRLSSKMPDAAA